MKVCLIAEGCYPYVVGGVSTWIQTLINEFSDIDFCVYAIGVNDKERGKFKYEIPKNVTEIEEIFLKASNNNLERKKNYKIDNQGKNALRSLIIDEDVNWNEVFDFFNKNQVPSIEILMGREFLELAMELYEKSYSRTVFVDFLWTLRSMYLPFFTLVNNPVPKADLYHSVSTGYAGVLASMGKYLYKKPFLLTEHGIYTREREEEIIKAEWAKGYFKDMWIQHFYKLSRCAYNYADKVVSLFSVNRDLQIELGCPEEKTAIIPNGIRYEKYFNLPEKEETVEALNIGAIVRVVPIKDIKTMIMAFNEANAELPNTKFYIMGPMEEDPEYYDECIKIVDSFELDNIIFTGRIDVKQYIGKMDILVLTSISEAQPISILEGMAASKPWVVTNVGACRELIEGRSDDDLGTAGFVVPTMNISSIASAIIKLGKDKQLREKMGNVGLKRVEKYYRQEDFIEEYSNIYEILGGAVPWQA